MDIAVLPLSYHIYGDDSDFFNWNRVKLRYCDGASFTGDSENKVSGMFLQLTFFH